MLGVDCLIDTRTKIDIADQIVNGVEADCWVEATEGQTWCKVVLGSEVAGNFVLDCLGDAEFVQEVVDQWGDITTVLLNILPDQNQLADVVVF